MFPQFKRLTWKASLLATIMSILAFTYSLAAPGDLDTTFDGDGLVTTDVSAAHPGQGDIAQAIAIGSDGKIVAAGYSYQYSDTGNRWDFAVTRYNINGTLDTTFSQDGRLVMDFGGYDSAYDVAVQSNGKIVVVGKGGGTGALGIVRYNSNGTLDTTFSGDGKQTTPFGGANAVAIQSNGRIIVAGSRWNGNDSVFAVYRYLSNGSLDTTFSGDGKASFGFGAGRFDDIYDIVIQPDGKIVVAGTSGIEVIDEDPVFFGDFAIARLNPNGTFDTTFSGDGKQTTNFGADDAAQGFAGQVDGKMVLAGRKCVGNPDPCYLAVARYKPDGSLDTTFDGDGKKVFTFVPPNYSNAFAAIVLANGRIVVTGVAITSSGNYNFALARLLPNGAFDTSFSGDGKVLIDFGDFDWSMTLAPQPLDGKYVLGGWAYDGISDNFALARVLP